MRNERHLTKPGQYALVYNKGGSRATSLIVMKFLPNQSDISRYGFSVSKRVGKAVIRNRMKRLLREIMRRMPLKPGWDIVLIVRLAAAGTGYGELETTLEAMFKRAGLLEADEGNEPEASRKTADRRINISGVSERSSAHQI